MRSNASEPVQSASLTADIPLSKNAQKRNLKAKRREENKALRKAKGRELKKARKRARSEELDHAISKRARTSAQVMAMPFRATVIIDLAFDELMSEKECKSMASQLCHTYASNRRAPRSFESLVCTSLGGRLKLELEAINDGAYRRWRRVLFTESSYEELCSLNASDVNLDDFKESSGQSLPRFDKNKLVYLTADSENEITELSEDETYIIGGIVDRNRHKNLCFNKAKNKSIHTARLPIGTYLSDMKTSKVGPFFA